MSETWRTVPGFPDYEASDLGRLRSNRRRYTTPRILPGSPHPKTGHLLVGVVNADGTPVHTYIHRLVLLAFVGPRPDGLVTRHLDGDPSNNRLSNLRYGTHSDNQADRAAHVASEITDHELSLNEAARILGLGPAWVTQLTSRGELAGRKVRGQWVLNAESVATYVRRPVGRPRKKAAA